MQTVVETSVNADLPILALLVYGKNEQVNPKAEQRKAMLGIVARMKQGARGGAAQGAGGMAMASKRTNVADELLASLGAAAAILRGEAAPARVWNPPACIDVRAIRRGLGLSQPAFAHRFGFSVSAVREWEQGRRQPEAAARVLLLVIAKRPEVVDEVLAAAAAQAA